MIHVFSSATADDLWLKAAYRLNKHADYRNGQSRVGKTQELMHVGFELKNPRLRWVSSRRPALNVAFALAEVIWIIRGRNDSAFVNYFNRELPKFAGDGRSYHGAYGFRLRSGLGLDQIEKAYQTLKLQPDSRQVVLQIWDSSKDLPNWDGQPSAPDIPCNLLSMLKIRDGKLEWTQVMRSNDLYLGWVHNIVQFTCLQEIMAGWLQVGLGSYHHFSDSLHVYERDAIHLENIQRMQQPSYHEDLSLDKELSDRSFLIIERLVEVIIDPASNGANILTVFNASHLPPALKSISIILTCEGLRRRGESKLVRELLLECQNLTLDFMYRQWLSRLGFEH